VVGFGVAFEPVLWSPVGAPAGVPGPRRNADDCDAGWFAPVATRRRPIFGAFQAPSPRLAVFPGGTPPGAPRWAVGPGRLRLRPSLWSGHLAARRAASVTRDLLAAGTDRPRIPSRFSPLLAAPARHATRGVWTALSQVKRLQDSGRQGVDGAEGCSRSQLSAGISRSVGPEVAWARSSVRAQAILRADAPRAGGSATHAGGWLAGHGVLGVPS